MRRVGRRWWMLGGSAAVVVILIAITLREGWLRAREAESVSIESLPVEFHGAIAEFDLRPGAARWDAVREEFLEAVRARTGDLGLAQPVQQELVGVVGGRVGLLVAPEYETWRGMAGDLAPPEADPGHPDHEAFRERWELAAGVLRGSALSTGGVVVRRIPPGEGPQLGTPSTIFMRTGGFDNPAVRYPDPPVDDPSVVCVEVLVPMEYQLPDASGPIKVTAAMRFYRAGTDQGWRPTDLFLYFDSHGFGKRLVDPIY